jgi:hypothetical protein
MAEPQANLYVQISNARRIFILADRHAQLYFSGRL